MKKVLASLSLLSLCCTGCTSDFSFDSSKLSFFENSKNTSITESFNQNYNLTKSLSTESSALEEKIISLTKKTTYLLLGDFNNTNESSEEYYKRHQDYLNLRYNPSVPKDENTTSGLDETSEEYRDDLLSGITIPSMFLKLNELGITYRSYGDIRVTINDNVIISSILLPKISIKTQNTEDPMKYDLTETNLIMYYYFKELNGEYKLYYLFGETTDDLTNYLTQVEEGENSKAMLLASSYDSSVNSIYNLEKLNSVSYENINKIYEDNKTNIVHLTSYYNNTLVSSANGFFIKEGLIVTTWHFLEESLKEGQYILIQGNNESYEMDGIVTVNIETDLVVLKMKNKNERQVTLGESESLSVEDPLFTLSSKTGVGLSLQKGIMISKENYIQSTISLQETDQGSPLFDLSGNVVGMNTNQSVNSSISIAISSDFLKEIQEKFESISWDKIDTVSFMELKENFYYTKYSQESVKNKVSDRKWKEYSKIGDIENTINLELLKASYKDGILSLRYKNGISKYITSMQLASSFKEQLIEEGYKETLNSSKKTIYENSKYKIIIMDEFDYLIIVMVKL